MSRMNIGHAVRLAVSNKIFPRERNKEPLRSGMSVVLQEVASVDVQNIAYKGLWQVLEVHIFFKAILKNDIRNNFHRHHKRLLIENRTP